jgi:hypothetical protein
MGKGIVADSSPYNYSAARSTAFKEADVVLVLGARLNWILAFGLPPKWSATVKIVQVDICADELGKNGGDPALSLLGDVGATVEQLMSHLGDWQWQSQKSSFLQNLDAAQVKNRSKAAKKSKVVKSPMMFEQAFDIIKTTLDSLSTPADGDIVYVSEGANAMDISRSIFTMEHPRTRLDAGTYATMGVGLGYACAAYAAYNFPRPEGVAGKAERKKIVCIEGDSAFGFSGMEVETMARYDMDVLIFIMNNNGLYRGDTDSAETYKQARQNTIAGSTTGGKGLTAWSLGYQTNYHKIAEMAGGIGFEARTPEELKDATEKGYRARVPVVINVIINSQSDLPMVSPFLRRYKSSLVNCFLGLLVARHGSSISIEAKVVEIYTSQVVDRCNNELKWNYSHYITSRSHYTLFSSFSKLETSPIGAYSIVCVKCCERCEPADRLGNERNSFFVRDVTRNWLSLVCMQTEATAPNHCCSVVRMVINKFHSIIKLDGKHTQTLQHPWKTDILIFASANNPDWIYRRAPCWKLEVLLLFPPLTWWFCCMMYSAAFSAIPYAGI